MLNELVALETDRNPKLTVLHCAFNRSLKALDVTGNPLLKELVCTENSLSSLDVSHNLELKKLMCGNGFVKRTVWKPWMLVKIPNSTRWNARAVG